LLPFSHAEREYKKKPASSSSTFSCRSVVVHILPPTNVFDVLPSCCRLLHHGAVDHIVLPQVGTPSSSCISHAMDLSAANAAVFAATTTPVVLQVMPLPGSPAPIGYIYNPTPTHDGDGGLLAAASAFFIHHGHQVFHDPCPDLGAYRRAGGIMVTIIKVDQLPDHVLTVGLDLLKTPSLLPRGTPLALPLWRHTFLHPHLLSPRVWSPFHPWGILRDGPSPFWAAPVMGGLWGALVHSPLPLCLPRWCLPTPLGQLDHYLTFLTHGGSAATQTLNLVSRSPAEHPSLPLDIFPLRSAMGGVTAVRSLGHLHCPHL
jgi:hypothetical protein